MGGAQPKPSSSFSGAFVVGTALFRGVEGLKDTFFHSTSIFSIFPLLAHSHGSPLIPRFIQRQEPFVWAPLAMRFSPIGEYLALALHSCCWKTNTEEAGAFSCLNISVGE